MKDPIDRMNEYVYHCDWSLKSQSRLTFRNTLRRWKDHTKAKCLKTDLKLWAGARQAAEEKWMSSQTDDVGSTQSFPTVWGNSVGTCYSKLISPGNLWLANISLGAVRRLTFRETGPNITHQKPESVTAWLGHSDMCDHHQIYANTLRSVVFHCKWPVPWQGSIFVFV